jgi:hypothetical protein
MYAASRQPNGDLRNIIAPIVHLYPAATVCPMNNTTSAGSVAARTGVDLETLKLLEQPGCASIAPGGYVGVDGTLVVGLCYQTDYRAEEERGVSELRSALTSDNMRRFQLADTAADNIAYFTDVRGMMLSTQKLTAHTLAWGEPIPARWDTSDVYAGDYSSRLHWQQERSAVRFTWATVETLRQNAKKVGIRPLPRTKTELVAALEKHPDVYATAKHPERWPAWFAHGDTLVLRADHGITADILDCLIDAAKAGTLGIGNGSGPFATGLFLYDTVDETDAMVAAREAQFDWYDARMAELEPVKAELKKRGHRFYFLGNPREGTWTTANGKECGATRYWLNGHGQPQPCGWYTLDELLAEKFVADSRAKHEQRAAQAANS